MEAIHSKGVRRKMKKFKRPTLDGIAFVLFMFGGATMDSEFMLLPAILVISSLTVLVISSIKEKKDYYKQNRP